MKVLEAYPVCREAFRDVVEESGGVHARCMCPLKEHRSGRTVRLSLGDDGRLLIRCFAGCSTLEILRAVGLSWSHTYPAGRQVERIHQQITAHYDYRDESGNTLYQTIRLEPGMCGRDKEFRQRRPNPDFDPTRPNSPENRRWLWSLGDVRRVLYRLPQIATARIDRTVYVVAGEKDADTLTGVGLLATTSVCGEAAQWLDSYSVSLAGRPVVVVEDADATGRRHANEVCGSLIAHRVLSLRRVGLPEKDSTAYLNGLRARGVSDAGALRAAFELVCSDYPIWSIIYSAKKTNA